MLRSFLAVARFSSFTDAAGELGFTQSTVTSHVQKLERQLGARLLDRLSSGVRLTDTGHRLVPRAEELLAAEDRLRDTTQHGTRPIGTVRVMAPESLCTYRLPAVITAVRASEPDVQVWVAPGGMTACLDAVRRGAVDVGLCMEPRLAPGELAAERLGAEPLAVLDHPALAAVSNATSWAELARRDALLIEEGCGYSDDVARHLTETGEKPGRRSRFGSVEAIKRCVAAGLGWTALPVLTATEEIDSGALQALDAPALPDCDVHVITHPRRHHGPATDAVLEALRDTWARPSPEADARSALRGLTGDA
ncbi:LysR family transcriptional regulator [Georgenia halophila]|uniref:LysR family transcriptional regulator n=1 Tax=Georgenia halophila TaxID=620889 RepID=A0ABP8LCA8_9MICO